MLFRSTIGAGLLPYPVWRQIWGRSTWAMELGCCHSARRLLKRLGCDWDIHEHEVQWEETEKKAVIGYGRNDGHHCMGGFWQGIAWVGLNCVGV